MNFIEKKASNNKNNTKSILPKLAYNPAGPTGRTTDNTSDHMPNVPVKEFIGGT